MNLGGTRSRLGAVAKELSLKWRETKNYWKDARSLEFEHRYIEELLVRVDKAVTVIEKLDVLLARVKKDCE